MARPPKPLYDAALDMTPSRDEMLRMLLSNLFGSSIDELRIFLRESCGEEILMHLPGGAASSFTVIGEAVDVLRRRGAITPDFFAALHQRFPRRGPDIEVVGATWGSNLASSFLPPVVTLLPRNGHPVSLVAWQLRMRLGPQGDLTRSQLARLLRESSVPFDLRNFGRRSAWPYVLQPQAQATSSHTGKTLHWYCEYPTGISNRKEDQHLQIGTDGLLVFQRDVLSDLDMIEMGELAKDVPRFLGFAGRVHAALKQPDPLEIAIEMTVSDPSRQRTVFLDPLQPEPPCRWVRYAGAGIVVERALSPTTLVSLAGLSAECHWLLESIANEFSFEPDWHTGPAADLLAIDPLSIARLVGAFFGPQDPY